MTLTVLILSLIGCFAFQSFFSSSEIAVVAADDLRLRAEAEESGRRGRIARLLTRLLARRERLLAATLTGTNLASVAAATLLTTFMHQIAPRYEFAAPFILAPLSLLLGESLPKLVALSRPVGFATLVAYPLRLWTFLIGPLLTAELWLGRGLRYLSGVPAEQPSTFVEREDLMRLLHRRTRRPEVPGTDAILPAERLMIGRILRFTRSEARNAMVPLVRVDAVAATLSQAEAVELVRREGFSRLPVYEGRLANLIGVVHVFDLLESPDLSRPVAEITRPISYFAESTPLDEVLLAMQRTRESIAAVVDEYGDAAGIITLEDLLEEVVGEIEDEYDVREELIHPLAAQTLAVAAHAPLSVLNERLGLRLPEGEGYATIGGLVVERLGHIPKPGEQIKIADATIKVVRSDTRAVRDLLLTLDHGLRPEHKRRP